jgi:hypothetical protein
MINVHFSLKSNNSKTGPIPVSTMGRQSCPDACSLKRNGCYGDGGPLSWHWRKVTEGIRGITWDEYCQAVERLDDDQLWRHAQVGDLPGDGDIIDRSALARLVRANRGRRGFTYTHKPVLDNIRNAAAVYWANRNGFTINLSANNLAHADDLYDTGIGPVVTVLPIDAPEKVHTPQGRVVVVCPAQSRDDITCATCGLCQRQDRTVIVGFRAHGTAKRKVENVFFKGEAA